VSLEPNEDIDEFESIGICGQPDWLQEAEIPTCPKSGKPMKFLCQLGSFSEIKSTFSNIVSTDGMAQYFEKLNFWCDGNLVSTQPNPYCYHRTSLLIFAGIGLRGFCIDWC